MTRDLFALVDPRLDVSIIHLADPMYSRQKSFADAGTAMTEQRAVGRVLGPRTKMASVEPAALNIEVLFLVVKPRSMPRELTTARS